MKFLAKFFAEAAPNVLAYGLSLAVPAIPASIWLAIIKGVLAGDLTIDHINAFLASHGIKTYYAPTDFPNAPPGQTNISNIGARKP